MFEVLSLVIFIWLMMKVIGLMFRLTWGMAKVIACLLIGLALPALFVCLIFVGGIALLVPLTMVAIAGGIIKACL